MRQDNKLNRALKGALGEHTEPLHEGQWERLSAVLGEKKKKRRILPWFMLFCIVGLSSLAIGFWLGGNKAESRITQSQGKNSAAGNSHAGAANEGAVKDQLSNGNGQYAEISTGDENDHSETKAGDNSKKDPASHAKRDLGTRKHVKTNLWRGFTHASEGSNDGELPVRNNAQPGKDKQDDKDAGDNNSSAKVSNTDPGKEEVKAGNEVDTVFDIAQSISMSITAIDDKNSIDASKKKRAAKQNGLGKVGMRARFAVGFATGFSIAQFAVKDIEHEEKMYKDARTIFDENNKNTRSQFVNLSFDWYPFKRLGFNVSAGVQYRQLQQDLNFDYKLINIPWRNDVGVIQFYLHDTSAPLVFNVREKNIYNFVNVPVRLGYTIPIGVKQELGVAAGLNLSFMTAAKGNSFVVDEVKEKPLKESYKKTFSTGYSGGFFYSRNLYRHWWIGLELQWQSTRMNYADKYATIKSSLQVKSYNCALRYKF